MNKVIIVDAFFLAVEDVDQEEKLLIVIGWQCFDVLHEVVQVFGCFLHNLLL
jgi:hypothetical protein